MQIKWRIDKKRGNFRPSLNYHIRLEAFEKELAVHAVSIQSRIPLIPNPHLRACMPGENERTAGWAPTRFHTLSVPYYKKGEIGEFIRLPFRASGEYPEVDTSFAALRAAYETVVRAVLAQSPIARQGEMGISPSTRETIAAAVTARRMLVFCAPTS
jgi:hypothetical protein